MNSTALIGITELRVRDARPAAARPGVSVGEDLEHRDSPTQASSTKKASVHSLREERDGDARPGRQHPHDLGHAHVRVLEHRQRRAVERHPGEQDRGDLVVPDERMPA